MRGHSDVEAIGPAPERLQFQFTTRRLRDFVDPDHLLIRIDEQFDFSKLVAPMKDRYCPDNGRLAIQPEVMIMALLICSLYNIPAVRRLRWTRFFGQPVEQWFCPSINRPNASVKAIPVTRGFR